MTDPEIYAAMRVADFMDDADNGRWRLRHFSRTSQDVAMEKLKIETQSQRERVDMELRRVVPEGTYITLHRKMTEQERTTAVEDALGMGLATAAHHSNRTGEEILDRVCPDDSSWIPVMSDTPAELEGHEHAVKYATGRVLVTGLGLGCIVQGLLAKPGVERIDVVEIDPEVIGLTGYYYGGDPRVHIWRGSAADPNLLPADLRWDYAWHDIWSHIAPRNLNDDTAEHGISYQRLFDLYDGSVEMQHAWAYEEALEMRRMDELERTQNIAWFQRLLSADEETKVQMLQTRVIEETHPVLKGHVTREIIRTFDPTGDMAAHLRDRLRNDPDFLTGLGNLTEMPVATDEPIGNPNAHLEQT